MSLLTRKITSHKNEHETVPLGPRNDGGVYQVYSHISSKRVIVIVLNIVKLDNKTALAKEFGSQRI